MVKLIWRFCFFFLLQLVNISLFQEYEAAGTVKQNYVNILLMLLRLRQACDHPLLVRGCGSSSAWFSSVEVAKKLSLERRTSLLNCLEASLAICGICNVCSILAPLDIYQFVPFFFIKLCILVCLI